MADLDLFGKPVQTARFRPGSRDGVRPWDPSHELCLWAVRRECGSAGADAAACIWLTELFGHAARPPAHVPPHVYARDAVSVVDDRVKTDHLALRGGRVRNPELLALGRLLFPPDRAGLPPTWAERGLADFYRSDARGVGRVPVADFLAMLSRPAADYGPLTAPTPAWGRGAGGDPCRPANVAPLRDRIAAFCHLPAAAPAPALRRALAAVCAAARS